MTIYCREFSVENKLFQTIFKVPLCSKAGKISLKTYMYGYAWITKYSNDRNWINKNSGLIRFERSKHVANLFSCSQFDTISFSYIKIVNLCFYKNVEQYLNMKYIEIHPKFLNINEWDMSGKSNKIGDKKKCRDTLGGFEKKRFCPKRLWRQ